MDAARSGDLELAAWFESADVSGQPGARWSVDWASGATTDPRFLRSFIGHQAPVIAVATAVVDGRPVVISGSRDTAVRVWDLATGGQLHELMAGRTDPLSSMTPELVSLATAEVDGRALALTLHADEAVRVWDPRTGRSAGELVRVVACTALHGRSAVLTVGADRALQVWDLATGSRLGAFASVADIGVLEGRQVAVTAEPDQPVQVWDLSANLQVGECLPVVASFLLEGQQPLALAGREGKVPSLWDLSTGHPVGPAALADPRPPHARPLSGPSALTVVGDRVVAMTLDHQDEPELVGDLAAGRAAGTSIRGWQTAVLGTRRVALVVGVDQTLRVWDLTAQQPDDVRTIRTIGPGEQLLSLSPEVGGRASLWELISGRAGRFDAGSTVEAEAGARTLDPRGWTIALTAEEDGTITVRDAADGSPGGRPLTGHTGRVWDVAATLMDGRPVAVTAGADHSVRSWDLSPAPAGRHRGGHTGSVLAIAAAVFNGSSVALTAGADHTLRAWDLDTGQQVAEGLGAEVSVMTTAVLDGRLVVVVAGPDATVQVLDPATGRGIHRPVLSRHGRVLSMAAATLDGRPVALTAGSDRTVGAWDLATGQPFGEPLVGHSSRVTAVGTIVVEGRPVVVTGSWDKTVRVWDLATGRQVGAPLTGHTDWVTSLATTTIDGDPVAISRGREGTVRQWSLTRMKQIGVHTAEPGSNAALAVTAGNDGRPVAAVGHGRTVEFLDLAVQSEVRSSHLLPLPVGTLAAAPDGRFVVAFGPDVAVLRPMVSRRD